MIRSSKHIFLGECISGALHWKEIFSLAKKIGFEMPRTVSAKVVEVEKPELKEVVGKILMLQSQQYCGVKAVKHPSVM